MASRKGVNLGTGTGSSVPSGGRIASGGPGVPGPDKLAYSPLSPSLTTNSTVSDYMGYGSFSGSDIKVIVHLPRDHSREKAVHEKIKTINSNIDKTMATNGADSGPEETQRMLNEVDGYNLEKDALDKELLAIKDLPTQKVLGEIQTLSWSIFREKSPVRTLGSVYPKTYVRGPRTIGGSMIFTVFNQHVLHELLELDMRYYSTGTGDFDKYQYTSNLADQLPPLDITLLFANEYGAISYMGLYGVEFVQEGGTFSIEDIFSESVVQYVARDLDPLRTALTATRNSKGISDDGYISASNLSNEKNVATRRNTFI
jgi:hypothetical protein